MSVGIGVIGTGVMGAAHVETIVARTARAHVAALYDADHARAEAIAVRAGSPRLFADPLALIASDSVEAVMVASPDETHFDYVAASIRAGKPVLCEKPLASTSAECAKLVDLEAAAGRRLVQVGFMRRFDPFYAEIKAAYESGTIGPARIVRCAHRNAVAPSFFRPGMAITNAMVHEFDTCRWLLATEIRRIRVDRLPQQAGSTPDDPLLATLETSAGQVILVEVFMNAGYGYDIRTELVGLSGVLTVGHPPAGNLTSKSGASLAFPADFTIRFMDAYRLQMQAWVDWIQGGPPCGASTQDGLASTLVAEAGLRALQSGSWEDADVPSAQQPPPPPS